MAETQKNIGTAEAPLYVPEGSPGDLNITNPTAYQQQYGNVNTVNTSQPSPQTVNATPYTNQQPQPVPVNTTDLKAGLQAATQSGQQAPDTMGQGASAVQAFSSAAAAVPTFYKPDPNSPQVVNSKGEKLSYDKYIAQGGKADFSNVQAGNAPVYQPTPVQGIEAQLAQDPGYQQLLKDYTDYNSTLNQTKSLTDTYNQIASSSGLENINTELLNTKKIIDGTEDDIRNEVKAANGFASDSQILALTSARNKTLIKNYNALVDQQTNIQNKVNTMVNLAGQDRTYALQVAQQKLQIDEQIINYRQKFIDNAKEAYKNIISAVGYDGLYNSVKNDPNSVSLVEKTLGLTPGTLQQASTFAEQKTTQERAKAELENKKLEAEITQMPLDAKLKQAQIANLYSEIGSRNSAITDVPGLVAYAQQYAATGQIPTGLPKGTFGAISALAKELPKNPGTLVDKNTGIKPQGNDTQIAAYGSLYSAIELSKQLKELNQNRLGGIIPGTLGKIFGSSNQQKYIDLKNQIVDLLARARSGAALTQSEEERYSNMLPGRFSKPLGLGVNSNVSIDNFTTALSNDLNNKLNVQGYSIYGFSTIKMPDGKDYKVGDIISNGTQQARVNPDGSLTSIQQ